MLGCGLGSALCFIDDLVSEQKCLIIPFIERGKNYETRTLQGKTFFMGIPMGKYPMGGERGGKKQNKKKKTQHIRMQQYRLEEVLVGFHLLHRQGN